MNRQTFTVWDVVIYMLLLTVTVRQPCKRKAVMKECAWTLHFSALNGSFFGLHHYYIIKDLFLCNVKTTFPYTMLGDFTLLMVWKSS